MLDVAGMNDCFPEKFLSVLRFWSVNDPHMTFERVYNTRS